MLPNSSTPPTSSSTIHINPKFRNVHINPNFLGKPKNNKIQPAIPVTTVAPTQIYINPRFLNSQMQQAAVDGSVVVDPVDVKYSIHLASIDTPEQCLLATEPLADTKIHTRTKIINTSRPKIGNVLAVRNIVAKTVNDKPLIKIGSKKLIRAASNQSVAAKTTMRRPLQTKYKIVKEQSTFKIDRRSFKAKQIASTVRKPLWISESLVPVKAVKRFAIV